MRSGERNQVSVPTSDIHGNKGTITYQNRSGQHGSNWLANNSSVSERTKRVDIRAHFVRSLVMDEVVTIDLVKLAENTSDTMTKNQQSVHYKSAQPKLVYTVQDMEKAEKKV